MNDKTPKGDGNQNAANSAAVVILVMNDKTPQGDENSPVD